MYEVKVAEFYYFEETIDDSIGLFNPVEFLVTAISLYSLDFLNDSEEIEDMCLSRFEEETTNVTDYCHSLSIKYNKTAEVYGEFIDNIYNYILTFGVVLVVFMFVKGYFSTYKYQNKFRQVEIFKLLGVMLLTIVCMFFIKDIMLAAIKLFSSILGGMLNVLTFSETFAEYFEDISRNIGNMSDNINNIGFSDDSDGGFFSFLDVEKHFKDAIGWVIQLFLNIAISIMGTIMLVKIIVVVLERFISLSMYTVISPIFVAQYVDQESKKQAKKFFKLFLAKLVSALILVLFLMFFIFVSSIFLLVLEFVFVGEGSKPLVSGVAFFYLYKLADRVVAGADQQSEKLFT